MRYRFRALASALLLLGVGCASVEDEPGEATLTLRARDSLQIEGTFQYGGQTADFRAWQQEPGALLEMQVGDVTLDAIYDQQSLEFFIAPDVTLIQVHRDMLGEFGVYLLNLWEPIAQEMPAHELLLNVSLDHWGGISYDTPLLYTPQSNLPRPIFAAPDLDPNVDLSGL